jgi:xanthine dehydrogenase YagR molybdenum-binding subunit
MQARMNLVKMAVGDPQSPVHGMAEDQVEFKDGKISIKEAAGKSEGFQALVARHGGQPVEGTAHLKPDLDKKKFSSHSFGAVFAEVAIDPMTSMVRVRRVTAVYDVGRIMNAKLARSQFIGGIVWGISLALLEDTYVDPATGRITNANLAEYHVPANLDVGEIDASALDIPDPKLDSMGARGIGEIGITGTGAAVANAIYHATGKRVRDLPITPDKLL